MLTNFTNRLLGLALILGLGCSTAFAQVSGISYTVSPSASYNFWDAQAGIGDGFLAGGHLGIGFGENVELRGMYLFDLGLKTNFDDYEGLPVLDLLPERDVNLTRYGGEVRLNVGRSKFLPFVTLGAGIQETELDGGPTNETVFASAGLGITLSVADRFTFKIEGKNTAYNANAVRGLITEADRSLLNLDPDDFNNERLYNYSVGAGLTVYLGGRRPGTLSDVDRAYAEAFTDGFKNVSLLVEPTIARINFDDALPYKDMYLGGGAVGLDFGPLVGFRAYYLKGMEDDELTLDFDDIAVWGADFRFRFSSTTTGLSPFVSLGGGYIDTQDEYRGENNARGAASQAFAAGGAGASINLSRSFRLLGTYKILATTGTDVEDVESTDQIKTSNMWSVGLNLAFGKKAERPDAMFTSVAQQQLQRQQAMATLEQQNALADQARQNAEDTKELRNDYEVKLLELREQLAATDARDTATIAELEEAIADSEEVVEELEEREAELESTIATVEQKSATLATEIDQQAAAAQSTPAPAAAPQNQNQSFFRGRNADGSPAPGVSRLTFTPAEFEGLIEEIFEGLNYGMPALPPMMMGGEEAYDVEYDVQRRPAPAAQDTARINQMERQLKDLRNSVMELTRKQEAAEEARTEDKEALRKEMKESTQSILEEIRSMRQEMANKSDMTDKEREQIKKDAEKAARDAQKAAEKAAKEAEKAAKKNKN